METGGPTTPGKKDEPVEHNAHSNIISLEAIFCSFQLHAVSLPQLILFLWHLVFDCSKPLSAVASTLTKLSQTPRMLPKQRKLNTRKMHFWVRFNFTNYIYIKLRDIHVVLLD